jgi:transposase-like protein
VNDVPELRIVEKHQPVAAAAAAFGVSETTVYKWLRCWRTGGEFALAGNRF